MKTTIIIHHLQEMWDSGLQNMGTSFERQLELVVKHLEQNCYDDVIVTNFEANQDLDDEQWPLAQYYPTVYDYAYGWEKSMMDTFGDVCTIVEGGNHSEVVIVDDWMKELQGEIFLCGAFDGECIEDMEIALEGAGKTFKRIEELIV